jgi:formylglycine-generating enzyme required for sulfatase activity
MAFIRLVLFVSIFVLLPGRASFGVDRPIVAVFNVEAKNTELTDGFLDSLADYISTRLTESGRYSVVPRRQLKERLESKKIESHSACFDQSCQIELGRELAASKVLAPSVLGLGSSCTVTFVFIDLKRAATEAAASQHGKCDYDSVLESVDKAIGKLLGRGGAGDSEASRREFGSSEPQVLGQAGSRPKEDMLLVPGGKFFRGCNEMVDRDCRDDEKPGRAVQVSAFFIDRHEVTTRDYMSCVANQGCRKSAFMRAIDADHLPSERSSIKYDEYIMKHHSDYNFGQIERLDHPINGVTWIEAQEYCKWLGNRLPTEAEWEKAARAADGRKYPWGDKPVVSCNLAVVNNGAGGCGQNRTWPVCAKPAGSSPVGACDLIGNVREWVQDRYSRHYYETPNRIDPAGPGEGWERVVRGGSWTERKTDRLRCSLRASHEPDQYSPDIGFRCAKGAGKSEVASGAVAQAPWVLPEHALAMEFEEEKEAKKLSPPALM